MSKAKKELLSKLIRDLNSDDELFEIQRATIGCADYLKHKAFGLSLDFDSLSRGQLRVRKLSNADVEPEMYNYQIELNIFEVLRLARAFNNWKAKHLLNLCKEPNKEAVSTP